MRSKEDLAEELVQVRDDANHNSERYQNCREGFLVLLNQLDGLEVNNVTRLALDKLSGDARILIEEIRRN